MMKKLIFISILCYALTLYAKQQDIEMIGTVKKENINSVEVLVFITDKNEKFEVSGKLSSFVKSFYLNKKIKILGAINSNSNYPSLSGKVEIKEIIVNL